MSYARYISDSQARLKLASIYSRLGHIEKLYSILDKIDLNEIDDESIREIEVIYENCGDFYNAERLLLNLCRKTGEIKDIIKLSRLYSSIDRYYESEEILKCFLKNESDEYYFEMAQLLFRSKDINGALKFLSKAGDNEKTMMLKSKVLIKKGEYKKASLILEKIINTTPSAEAYFRLILLNKKMGEIAQNEKYIENLKNNYGESYWLKFLEGKEYSDNKDEVFFIFAGDRYIEESRFKDAEDYYRKALLINNDNFNTCMKIAETLAIEQKFSESESMYNKLLLRSKNNYKVLLGLGRVLSWDRKYKKSLDIYERLCSLSKTDTIPMIERARVFFWAKDYSKSYETYDRTIKRAEICGFQGEKNILSLEKEYKKRTSRSQLAGAFRSINRFIELNPGDLEAIFDRAQIECRLGMINESLDDYKKIHIISPGHIMARNAYTKTKNQIRDRVGVAFKSMNEKGRDSISGIHKLEIKSDYRSFLSDNEIVSISRSRGNFKESEKGERFSVNRLSIGLEHVTGPNISLKGELGWNSINKGIGDFRDYSLNLKVLSDNPLSFNFKAERKGEFANRFSILQKTLMKKISSKIMWKPHYKYDIFFENQKSSFNDSNKLNFNSYGINYFLRLHPSSLVLNLSKSQYSSDHKSIFTNVAGVLTNIKYPYWTPESYGIRRISLKWERDLSIPLICTKEENKFYMEFVHENDDGDNIGNGVYAGFSSQLGKSLDIKIEGYIFKSDDWNTSGIRFEMGIKF